VPTSIHHELTHELAQANRSIGVTSANEHSSRSHLIVTLYVTKEDQALGKQVHGKLHLVDLAGSERQGKALTQGAGLSRKAPTISAKETYIQYTSCSAPRNGPDRKQRFSSPSSSSISKLN